MGKSIWRMLLIGLPMIVSVPAHLRAADATPGPTGSVTPVAGFTSASGAGGTYREQHGMDNGAFGGIEDSTLDQKLGKDSTLHFEGRGLFNQEDYKLRLELVKPDVGFVRAGFTEYRRYYEDTGGFVSFFNPSSFDLDNRQHLDVGNLFVELGLTLPKLPRVTIGYERQFRDGTKSLLEWGDVTEGIAGLGRTTRRIYPSVETIDETTDIFKADLEHDVRNVHVVDQFRYEHWRNDTKRTDTSVDQIAGAAKTVTVKESYDHDAFFNTFHLDSFVNEKVYWSLGYLYTRTDGGGKVALDTQPFNAAFDKNWFTQALDLDQNSHVVNANVLVGPFKALSGYVGLQFERTETEGLSDAVLTEMLTGIVTNPLALSRSSNDKTSFEETAGLRFTGIPFTTLYVDGRWTQQTIDLIESQTEDGIALVDRSTDTDVVRQQYTAGFNSSPWRRVTVSAHYRRIINNNDYDHGRDISAGYPAFITSQDFTTDEVMARLSVRPCSKFTLALEYKLQATDFQTAQEGVPGIAPGTTLVPAGSIQSGAYDAAIYSVSATVTPTARLWLTGLFSFQDTRTHSFANDNPAVLTYRGNVYTALGAAGYALDAKTDATLEYTFSMSGNFTDNSLNGLPLGLDYHQQGVMAGLSRRVTKNVTARLRYGYFEYRESSNGGIDNYHAHLASASCAVRF